MSLDFYNDENFNYREDKLGPGSVAPFIFI